MQSLFFKLKSEIKESLQDKGENPNPTEGLRATVQANRLKKKLDIMEKESLSLSLSLHLPKDITNEIVEFHHGQKKIDNLKNRR